jgi:pimeloyl-ACP methyl ester carboxylesterase
LVGHALGATVAVSFAMEYPQDVDRIMAVSLPLDTNRFKHRVLSGSGSILDRVLGRSPLAGYDDVEREANQTAPKAIKQSVRSVLRLNVRNVLQQVSAPLLVVYGAQDNVVEPMDIAEFVGKNRSMRTIELPQCKHFPMLDRSSQFNRLLLDFLKNSGSLDDLALKNEWQRRIR